MIYKINNSYIYCLDNYGIIDGYCQYIKNEEGKLLSERLCAKNANYNYLN